MIAVISTAVGASAQTKRTTKKPKKVVTTVTSVASPAPPQEQVVPVPPKRNERPGAPNAAVETSAYVPTHFYEFTRPGFAFSRILIEHDGAGIGRISFEKDGSRELISDPIRLSPLTLGTITNALNALNFLDSTETYQHERDYSHLGNVEIRVRTRAGERAVKFNWTSNKHAKTLMDEYRRIGNEGTWRFEIASARENYPLQAPGIMNTLESYLKRNEISDPHTLLPFLIELSSDERLPLMARNTAAKLVKQIENKKRDS